MSELLEKGPIDSMEVIRTHTLSSGLAILKPMSRCKVMSSNSSRGLHFPNHRSMNLHLTRMGTSSNTNSGSQLSVELALTNGDLLMNLEECVSELVTLIVIHTSENTSCLNLVLSIE